MLELSGSRITIDRDSNSDTYVCQRGSLVENDGTRTDSSLLLYVDYEITANGNDFDTSDDTAEDQYMAGLLNEDGELNGDAELKNSPAEGGIQAITYAEYGIKWDTSKDVEAPSTTTQTDTAMPAMETYDGFLPNEPNPECKRKSAVRLYLHRPDSIQGLTRPRHMGQAQAAPPGRPPYGSSQNLGIEWQAY
ncbi:uncharacterized protein FSUBG_2424 [Fusarium subglutinans]|uniref:Uncharacterized protein n=1 Tax=Gibberella subglutinans TaxID=42677 RepID=A0A8H5Q9U9_GIBSU|nr:uncharacterized protein FSUBG_2424 [Fusarium subglutinans]KAF5611319.1 hypothetical protein FSUBG_2424 [Fusarium subglutinans]